MADIKSLVQRVDRLKSERYNWEANWQDLAHYIMPRRAYITRTRTEGAKLDSDVYDGTAIYSNQVLAAGLHGYLTNPSSRWFALRMNKKELMNRNDVKIWLKNCEDEIFDTLNNSNFAQQIHEVYQDLGALGTSVMYVEEDEKERVRFFTRPLSEMILVENERERVDTVFRCFELTVIQAVERWGLENLGAKTRKAYEEKQYDKMYPFMHIIMPRWMRDISKGDAKNMAYASIYVDVQTKKVIKEGGYREFPFLCPRWNKMPNEAYGVGPGMMVYSDVRMLNAMAKTTLKSAQKIVDPPLQVPHDGYLLPLITKPGGVNYKMKGSYQDRIEPLLTGGNIPISLEMMDGVRHRIQKAYFVDLFMLLADKKNMTATEVNERVEEKMLLLGPALGRLMSELLDPLIIRVFNMLARNGNLPKPPGILSEEDYTVEYISPLARAQKISEINSINSSLAIIGQMAQVAPSVLDKINTDRVVDEIADIQGLNPEMLRDDDEVQAIREQRQQMEEMAMQLEMADKGAGAAKKAAEAKRAGQG